MSGTPGAEASATAEAHAARRPVLDGPSLLAAAREVVGAGGEMTILLTGESMIPTLRAGDRLLLGGLDRAVRRFDIVLAEVRGTPVVHRVISVTSGSGPSAAHAPRGGVPDRGGDRAGGWIRTRGDACRREDPAVPAGAVAARVVASQRDGRWTAHAPTLRFGLPALARGICVAARAFAARRRTDVRMTAARWARPEAPR